MAAVILIYFGGGFQQIRNQDKDWFRKVFCRIFFKKVKKIFKGKFASWCWVLGFWLRIEILVRADLWQIVFRPRSRGLLPVLLNVSMAGTSLTGKEGEEDVSTNRMDRR